MPLGASRINFLGKSQAVAALADSVGVLNTQFLGDSAGDDRMEQFYSIGLAKCGLNSSDEPVFITAYATDARTDIVMQMFSVATDGTATPGTMQTVKNGVNFLIADVTTEREDAYMLSPDSGADFGCVCYYDNTSGNDLRVKGFSFDTDALTFTLGSELTVVDNTATGTNGSIAYANGYYYVNTRGGANNNFPKVFELTRSGTTMSATGDDLDPSVNNWGGFGADCMQGFDSQKGVLVANGNNNDRIKVLAFKNDSGTMRETSYSAFTDDETNTRCRAVNVNGTDKFAMTRYENSASDTNVEVQVGQVTWGGSGVAPTVSFGNTLEVSSSVDTRISVGEGTAADHYYFWNHSTSGQLTLKKIGVSGTTSSETYSKTITGVSGRYAAVMTQGKATTDAAGNEYLVITGYYDGKYPNVWCIVNPDDLS